MWSIANHPKNVTPVHQFVATVLLCNRRLATTDDRNVDSVRPDAKTTIPPMPIELWLIVFEYMELADLVPVRSLR